MSVAARRALARVIAATKILALFVWKKRLVSALLAPITIVVLIAPGASATNPSKGAELIVRTPAPALAYTTSAAERARGMVFAGLTTSTSSCPGSWAVRGLSGICTHGPDPAPAGVDVSKPRTTAELVAATDEGSASSTSGSASVPCYGDGSSGKRVQVVYAHASDVADRFSALQSSLVQWTANVDKTFSDSAATTGGVRHVRWATDSSCNLVIQRVKLSTTGDDAYGNTVSELKSVGLNRTDRKYLLWVDATLYCGVASLTADDSASLTNANNTGNGYARIDSGCWGSSNPVEAHELMHILGGVQYSAPHSSGGGHCYDAQDRMCYGDGGSYFQNGGQLTYPCVETGQSRLFDCNHDDYFSTNPVAGSYLASHWNTASSSFLESANPDAWSLSATPTATSSPTPSPTPTQTSSTTSTSTITFSGTLNRKVSSKSYMISMGAGTATASITFSKAKNLTLSLAANGSTIASKSGGSPTSLSASVSNGTYSLTVSGGGIASFTLTVTYPTA